MRLTVSCTLAAALVAASSLPVAAQQSAPPSVAPTGVTADLLGDVGQLEKKLVGLVRAIPADKYAWRPAPGVRSIGEVVMHVAADNYLFPAVLGFPVDPSTGIKGDDYKTVQAFEQRKVPRDSALAELEKSFTFFKKSLSATPEARLGEKVPLFGQTFTRQQSWIMATTHLHEHLGQLIAYARSNGVTPPWSQGN